MQNEAGWEERQLLRRNLGAAIVGLVLLPPLGLIGGPWLLLLSWMKYRAHVGREEEVPNLLILTLVVSGLWLAAGLLSLAWIVAGYGGGLT